MYIASNMCRIPAFSSISKASHILQVSAWCWQCTTVCVSLDDVTAPAAHRRLLYTTLLFSLFLPLPSHCVGFVTIVLSFNFYFSPHLHLHRLRHFFSLSLSAALASIRPPAFLHLLLCSEFEFARLLVAVERIIRGIPLGL